jgi:hypothetical protein
MNLSNFRTALSFTDGYDAICREERNLAAIFYHLLLDPANLSKFLELIHCDHRIIPDEMAIFFEYAFARDLWSSRVKHESTARACIEQFVRPPDPAALARLSIRQFNEFFGAAGTASATDIQMPRCWSIQKYGPHIDDDEFFLRVCKFKWAFNAKPDIVIHTSRETAICIEAKVESGEGQYPSSAADCREFDRRNLPRVRQTELQKFIFEELLGIRAQYVFLVPDSSRRSATHQTLTWSKAFEALDCRLSAPFIPRWIGRVRTAG